MQRLSGSMRSAATSRAVGSMCASSSLMALPASCAVSSSTMASTAAMPMQRRYQFYTDPAKRDHEAFLATYDPLEVLGLPEDATAREVHEAYDRKKEQYAPGSKGANKHKLETVERAHALLSDVSSPYYTKAGAADRYRHRLQVDMLPKNNRTLVHIQLICMFIFVCIGMLMLLKQILLPMQKSLRAATR